MANGHGTTPMHVSGSDERFAALDERVTNLRTGVQHLERSTADGFARIDAKLGEMAAAFQAGQKTPWSTIWTAVGVAFSVLIGVGYLVYTPLQINQTKLEAGLIKLSETVAETIKDGPDTYIPRRENDLARARAAEDRANTLAAITDLRTDSLPRREWLLRNDAVNSLVANLQREVDQLRTDFGSTYSLRDALADMKSRLERAEMRDLKP